MKRGVSAAARRATRATSARPQAGANLTSRGDCRDNTRP